MFTCGGVEALPELVLVAGPGANDYDGYIGGGGGGDGVGEARLVRGPALASLGEGGGWGTLEEVALGAGGDLQPVLAALMPS